MKAGRLSRSMALALTALVGCLALAVPSAGAAKKTITKTFSKGVGGEQGGTAITIPDGAGPNTQIVRSPISVKGLNPRGNIKDVDVSARATHQRADDLEFYLASPRGVLNLSSDNGGAGNDYGAGVAGCGGSAFTVFDSDVPTLISTPGLQAPFAGSFAPEESLDALNKLGGKKATNATWSLLVEDDNSMSPTGTLDCWQLKIKQTNPKEGRK
jgi:subtilisin-like proprotein convertase family protein